MIIMVSRTRKRTKKSRLIDNAIIASPDPAHKYNRRADSDNKIKNGGNAGSVSNLIG
jgi:hypothetical protein